MRKEKRKNAVWTWEATAGVFCFVGGILAALCGGLLTASTWFLGAELHPLIRDLGTVLMMLTVPLLLISGCCLDWMEREPKGPASGSRKNEKGNIRIPHLLTAAVLFSVLGLAPFELHARQTVFNVPTTDVLDRGKVYFELDISAKPNDSDAVSKFSSFVPRLVVGAGGRVEVGLNILGNIQPGADSTTLAPAVKWKAYDGKDNGWAIAIGDNLYFPVRNKAYNAGTYAYTMAQKTFNKSTRVGFGGYFFSKNVVAANANRAGGQFTFEQPLNKKVTLAADWFTGKHGAGYFTPGVVFKVGPKITGYASYSIGNQNASRGNHYFLLEFGYNFN